MKLHVLKDKQSTFHIPQTALTLVSREVALKSILHAKNLVDFKSLEKEHKELVTTLLRKK